MNYVNIKFQTPPEGIFVHTKIEDEKGIRNEQLLKRQGNLYFLEDGTYVYYSPTHWAYVENVRKYSW